MADADKKIDEMRDMLHEMKPVLLDVREGQKAMDDRLRASELQGAAHGVKIDRLKEDVDGLGRKVRGIEVRGNLAAAVAPAPREGKWAAAAEFLGAIPAYWHFLGYVAAGALSVAAFFVRHKP